MENRIIIENVNKLPVPTWRWLKLNDSTVSCENPGKYTVIEPRTVNLPKTVRIENGLPQNFPQINTGMGEAAAEFTAAHALNKKTITVKENSIVTEPVSFIYELGDDNFFANDDYIYAEKNSQATLIFVYTSPYKARGFHAGSLKIFAEENAKINIIQLQTLGENFTDFNDVGIQCADNAEISVRQIVLGAKNSWFGSSADLLNSQTRLNLNLDYITAKNQSLDVNYVANIYGRKNNVQISSGGILMHNAKKIMRGTLDFKQGCKGSVGNENESVLLLDEDVQNKSIPLILCGEDDIEGNHSASIGEMDEAQLFYLYTRGLDDAQIRRMQLDSKIQLLCRDLPENLHPYILDYQKEAF